MKRNITVVGCGRWGSLIAWYLDKVGHSVSLYGRSASSNMQRFIKERKNDLLTLSESITLTTSLYDLKKSEIIVISIDSQGLQGFMDEVKVFDFKNKTFVLCMKGIEIKTGRRLSEVLSDNLDSTNKIAVWLGPGHVEEFYQGIPNCMVIDSSDKETKKMLVEEFSSELIRFYYGNDLIGNEIGAASKNVIGIAAGMLDGYHLSSLKGALMSRGTREIARLIKAMGGNELSAYGLCHLGDYEATVFSKYSHNRMFGESFVNKDKYSKLAEGYYTVKALVNLARKYNVELPICESVYEILYENKEPRKTLEKLFSRDLKTEF